MPKEVIRNRPEVDDGAGPWAEIGWSKGPEAGHVQLGVIAPENEARLMIRTQDPRDPSGKTEWVEVDCKPGGVGWFIQLDRESINRAIRTLRKARDDAFGRDE